MYLLSPAVFISSHTFALEKSLPLEEKKKRTSIQNLDLEPDSVSGTYLSFQLIKWLHGERFGELLCPLSD